MSVPALRDTAGARRDDEQPVAALRSRWLRVARAITAGVTFAASLSGLIFALWPAVRPEAPAATKGGTLNNPSLDSRVSFGQYLDRIDQSRSPYGPAQLRREGVLVGFDFRVTGYKNKPLPLRWQLIDARSGQQVAQSRDVRITPAANVDMNTWSIWVPVPPGRTRRFFIELELLDDRGTVPLGRLRTRRFAGV